MSDPFIGEIAIFSFAWAPKGYALCQGQPLPVSSNQALYALLGNNFGGNQTTFNLPNLQGRTPLSQGAVNNMYFQVGQTGGAEAVTLTMANFPSHTHDVVGSDQAQSMATPTNNYFATTGNRKMYAPNTGANAAMAADMIAPAGGGAAKENRQPYCVANYSIATVGTWPPRPW